MSNFNFVNKSFVIRVLAVFFCLLLLQTAVAQSNSIISVTPHPLKVTQGKGWFKLTNQTMFKYENDPKIKSIVDYFSAKIKMASGLDLSIIKESDKNGIISLKVNPDLRIDEEGYYLNVLTDKVEIDARTYRGLFYGMQTFLQLLPPEIESNYIMRDIDWIVPVVNIIDEPTFKYRGFHLDVSRHFVDVDFIKKQLDVLSIFKINKFHWHLTDDQGWRVEIKKYPALTNAGAQRVEGEGYVYGPFYYTQNQIKEIVAYAKERFIEVIPEIEMPGHAVAALTAYPQFSCLNEPLNVRSVWGVSKDVFCAGNDSTFKFIEDVITELVPLFESEYFHIGGDECPKDRWKVCNKCQQKIRDLQLVRDESHSAEEKLQSYFIQRVESFLQKYDKKIIAWDEVLEGGLSPSATVMSWRGEQGGIKAAIQGNDVIMTPNNWLYFDYYQGDSKISPIAIGRYTPLEKVYNYNPIPVVLDDVKRKHILGIQANMWNEYGFTNDVIEWRMYPRLLALAEVAWSNHSVKSYDSFLKRLESQRVRLDMHNVNYYVPQAEDKNYPSCNRIAFIDSTLIEFKTTEPVTLKYTVNGKEPNIKSNVYKEPLTFYESTTLKVKAFFASGKSGETRTIIIDKQRGRNPVENCEYKGLVVEYYKGLVRHPYEISEVPFLQEKINTPRDSKFRLTGYKEPTKDDYVSTIIRGYFNVESDDIYFFSSNVDQVWIDGELLINNVGVNKRHPQNDSSIALKKGYHAIKLVKLSATVGGWPSLWNEVLLYIRPRIEREFKIMDESYFY